MKNENEVSGEGHVDRVVIQKSIAETVIDFLKVNGPSYILGPWYESFRPPDDPFGGDPELLLFYLERVRQMQRASELWLIGPLAMDYIEIIGLPDQPMPENPHQWFWQPEDQRYSKAELAYWDEMYKQNKIKYFSV